MLRPKEMDAYLMKAIKGTAGYFKLSPEELARTAGCKKATWYRRIKDPEKFTLGELRRLIVRYSWDASTVCSFMGVEGR